MKCRGIYLLILVLQSVYLRVYLCFCLLFSSRTWASRLFFDNLICWISFRSLEVWSCSVWSFWFLSSWSRVRILIRSWSRLDFVAFSVSYYGFQFVQARLKWSRKSTSICQIGTSEMMPAFTTWHLEWWNLSEIKLIC